MQRNASMLKILKKVRFCRFYGFLCKKAVPCLPPPERIFALRQNLIIYYVSSFYKVTNRRKKKYFASGNDLL